MPINWAVHAASFVIRPEECLPHDALDAIRADHYVALLFVPILKHHRQCPCPTRLGPLPDDARDLFVLHCVLGDSSHQTGPEPVPGRAHADLGAAGRRRTLKPAPVARWLHAQRPSVLAHEDEVLAREPLLRHGPVDFRVEVAQHAHPVRGHAQPATHDGRRGGEGLEGLQGMVLSGCGAAAGAWPVGFIDPDEVRSGWSWRVGEVLLEVQVRRQAGDAGANNDDLHRDLRKDALVTVVSTAGIISLGWFGVLVMEGVCIGISAAFTSGYGFTRSVSYMPRDATRSSKHS